MPAQSLAFAHLVNVILGMAVLLDVDILPRRHLEYVGLKRAQKLAGDVLALDAVGHVLFSPVFIKSARTENHTSLPIGTCPEARRHLDV